jgi:chorismate synthase
MSNTFGDRFRVTTFGEAHGPAVGAVIDGCPAGLPLDVSTLAPDLARDVPDRVIGTAREEPNDPEILSGIYEGRTLGTPILILIRNEDVCSAEYQARAGTPRPGHADLTWHERYGHVDPRGGGRASGRECIARVAAGAVARALVRTVGVTVTSTVLELGGVRIDTDEDLTRAREEVLRVGRTGNSTGGKVQVTADGLPAGVGDPVFGKLTARLGSALLSIGGVKAVEFGAGWEHARLTGLQSNDPLTVSEGRVRPLTNRAGGTLGGISTGVPIVATLAVKPTPSIPTEQDSVNLATGEPARVSGLGRFDLNFAPRVAVVAEAMFALVLVDALLKSGHLHPTRVSESGE